MSNAAGLYDQDMDEVPRKRVGRPSRLDAATVQRALDQARAEHRARGLSGEPSDSSIHRLCTAPGETVPIGSRATLKTLLAGIRASETGAPIPGLEETGGEGEPQLNLDLAGKIEGLNPGLRQLLEALVDGAVNLSGSAAAADTRALQLEHDVAGLRRQVALAADDAARAAEEQANALREAAVRNEESEGAYFAVQEQLVKAADDRRRLGDLFARMRDRWLTTAGKASQAERQARETREESERRIREERQASEVQVADANRQAGEFAEKARQAEEAARNADTRAQDLARQLQAATETGNALRSQVAQLQANVRDAQNAARNTQDRADTLQQERDRLIGERDTAMAASRSAEAATSAAELAAGVLRAELDAARRARDKAEEWADRIESGRRSGEPA